MRTRSQRLEEESITKFKSIVPSDWLVRDKPNDYGIDLEVEIFKNDLPTGLVFWVQLKATDSEKKSIIETVRFKKEKLRQFRSYAIPVLIVRYSSSRNDFYFTWSNRSLFLNSQDDSNNVSVKFYDTDKWNFKTADAIEFYLDNYKRIKENKFQFPIRASIITDSGNITTELLRLKGSVEGLSNHLIFTNDTASAVLYITYKKNRLVFNLSNHVAISLGIGEIGELTNPSEVIAIGLTLLLTQVNRPEDLNQVIEDYSLSERLFANNEMLLSLLSHLLTGRYFKQNLKLVLKQIKENQDYITAAVTHAVILFKRSTNDKIETEVIDYFLNEMIEIAGKLGNAAIAMSLYNYANYCKSSRQLIRAFSIYNRARKTDPSYLERHYYLQEVGGVLFDLGRYSLSQRFYQKSLEIHKDNGYTRYLYSDALLYNGQYKKSLENLDTYIRNSVTQDSSTYSIAILRFSAITTMIELGAPESQKRQPRKAIDKLPKKEVQDIEKHIEHLNEAFEFDYLCSLAWYNLGYAYGLEKNLRNSFICYLNSALINADDVEAWYYSAIYAIGNEDTLKLLHHIIRAGYYYSGDIFLQHVLNYFDELKKGQNSKIKTQIEEFKNDVIQYSKDESASSKEMRLFDKSGKVIFDLKST